MMMFTKVINERKNKDRRKLIRGLGLPHEQYCCDVRTCKNS